MTIFRQEPPNGGVKCRWGRQKYGFSANIWLIRMLWTLGRRGAINAIVGRYLAMGGCWTFRFFASSPSGCSLPPYTIRYHGRFATWTVRYLDVSHLWTFRYQDVSLPPWTDQARSRTIHNHGRPWIMCMTARLDVTPKTTEQNRIVRTSKSEAEVTNNKKTALEVLYYWSNEAHYWQTRSTALMCCLFATAEPLVHYTIVQCAI